MTNNLTPAERVEIWDIEKLIPYEANAKIHDDIQIAKLGQAMKNFGFTQPIIVWTDGTIIIGHGRRLAALSIGLKRVPVVVRSDLSKAQADALRLSDNRVTSVDYDMAAIQTELQRLVGEDIDLDMTGFSDFEVSFSTDDIGELDDAMFIQDISSAVEEQKNNNAKAAGEVDDIAAPVGDAFGFKRVTIAESRTIRELMSKIEAKTGKTGVSALIEIMSTAA